MMVDEKERQETAPHPMPPQVKICGLTRADQARACAAAGAAAIGFVFYDKSPRNVSIEEARTISADLPVGTGRVGVFVDAPLDFIRRRIEDCGLTAVQLHGMETPRQVLELKAMGVRVIKSLFASRKPHMDEAARFAADACLVECGKGTLPGGNATVWHYADAREVGRRHPLILAGGLSPENVAAAVGAARPDAVDVSSGVEIRPGVKEIVLVKQFMQAVSNATHNNRLRRIF
ncbi:MAG: phosphoribosylanthranilate isomerase [Deltaproteobacteria bacterium]|jgi:phosphoribosylanthranilate isomerase|nr:phosphoribosylanthranilate isomerase [Deltaproteobacteria bacterium]